MAVKTKPGGGSGVKQGPNGATLPAKPKGGAYECPPMKPNHDSEL